MKGGKKMIRSGPRLEDNPELIHHIQLFLPEKDAARSCILSKSWLHAWSTIPDLRFTKPMVSACKQQGINYSEVVDATLLRYLRDEIPIQGISLRINFENRESTSFVEKWIRLVDCLKKLCLSIIDSCSVTLPDKTFSGKSLNSMRIKGSKTWPSEIRSICISSNAVIKCVSLRELFLKGVHICEEVLNHLLSTCTSLETIEILDCTGWNTIKVKNLRFLYQLRVISNKVNNIMEIEDVPKLSLFSYEANRWKWIPLPFNTDSLRSVTQLRLVGLDVDDGFFDMMQSKFPILESLTLDMRLSNLENFEIRCVSLKSLNLKSCNSMLTGIQVFASNLQLFRYNGMTMPSLSFPATAPKKVELHLDLYLLGWFESLVFCRMMETLTLSSEFDIRLTMKKFDMVVQSNGDFDFIARNVERLSLLTISDEGSWEHSPFFDAFFSICHPKHVVVTKDVRFDNNSFCKLMLREILEKKTRMAGRWSDYLKSVEINNPENGKWEILTDSWRSFLKGSLNHEVAGYYVYFKLNWSSP